MTTPQALQRAFREMQPVLDALGFVLLSGVAETRTTRLPSPGWPSTSLTPSLRRAPKTFR